MNGELDWVKADRCYGCKYAKRLDDRQIDGMFGRRFGCVNRGRIDGLRNAAVRAIVRNELDEAQTLVGNARDMWDDFTRKGYFECSASLAPTCYEREGEEDREPEPEPEPETNKFGVPYHVYRLLLDDGKEVYVDVGVEEEWGDIQPCLPDDCEDWRESVGLGNDSDGHRKIVRVVDEETGESLDPMKWARELVWPYAENYSS